MADQQQPDPPDARQVDAEQVDAEQVDAEQVAAEPEPEWRRRRRLAAVFGDVLPDTTSDERDPDSTDGADGEAAGDRWLRAQVPPHHG
jgi:hypothetical protein